MFKAKICIIADQIYKSGGIERVLSHRINYWLENGHEVHLITSENKQYKPYFHHNSLMIHHDLFSGFNKKYSLFSFNNLSFLPLYFLKLREVINNIKPDVLILTNYSYDYYLVPLISKKSYLIKEYHSSFATKKGLIGTLKKLYTKFYHTHVFLSEEERSLSCISNSAVIPNPIINKDTLPSQLADREKVILAAGRIVTIKGFERLIESWSRIASSYPDWRLEIYGDGESNYIQSLNSLISQKNVSKNTKIFPSINHLMNKMSNSRIYAMTSLTECFPMVLLEAMQSKMAIVAFDCPTGPRNIIKHQKTGILVNESNVEDFSLELEDLIKSNTLIQRLSDNAYDDVQQYNIDNIMKKWDTLIQKGIKA